VPCRMASKFSLMKSYFPSSRMWMKGWLLTKSVLRLLFSVQIRVGGVRRALARVFFVNSSIGMSGLLFGVVFAAMMEVRLKSCVNLRDDLVEINSESVFAALVGKTLSSSLQSLASML